MVGTIASRWARLATSGTTPPKRACSSTLLAIASTSSVSPRTMPDTGLVARRLDAEHEGFVTHRLHPFCRNVFRMTSASTSPGW